MDLGLQGKRALVTGSTAGIGFAAARALAAEGAQVTINGRTAPRVNAAVARLKADLPGASVTGVSADLGTAAGCEVMIQQRPELDILVVEKLCLEVAREFPHVVFFAGKMIFQREKWYHRLLHNETALAVERRLRWMGKTMVTLPVRVQTARFQ